MATDGLVIIGASLAGAKAAEGARAAGWSAPIRLVGAEEHLPYERPPLSKQVLIGVAEPSVAQVHPGSFYTFHEIDVLLGTVARSIDLSDKTVAIGGGRRLRFERLVLATGSSARALGVPGASLDGVQTLRTLDDVLGCATSWCPAGASPSSEETGSGRKLPPREPARCEVVICEPQHALLERVLGPEVGHYFDDLHRSHRVDLRLGTGVARFEGRDRVEGVRLQDGLIVEADLVVVVAGVEPKISLAIDAGLATDHGVLVDATLANSHPDVSRRATSPSSSTARFGSRVRVEHWANALHQGRSAGTNATGVSTIYDRIPYFFSDQYDMSMELSLATSMGSGGVPRRSGRRRLRGVLSVRRPPRRRRQRQCPRCQPARRQAHS